MKGVSGDPKLPLERSLRIAYSNAAYKKTDPRGRNAHIGQYIDQATASGHEIWTWPGDEHPSSLIIPINPIRQILTLRRMHALYVRLQENPPRSCRYALFPYRQVINSPLMVWEFNTVPEFNIVMGKSEEYVYKAIQAFKYYGQGCDLAVCVSRSLANYVQEKLGLQRVLVVPNGSDPDLFRPDLAPVRRVERNPDHLNVVWIGSADLRWQNFDLLQCAAELLWQSENRLCIAFHLIGRQFGLMRDMPPNVHYYGADNYSAIPHWLAAMDVGLCLYHPGPADYGSPLKLFDYLASGLAVVATPQPQICEIYDKLGLSDLIVPGDDPAVLVDVLLKLAKDRQRVHRIGSAGRQLVIETYNWRRAVKSIFDEIEALLKDRH